MAPKKGSIPWNKGLTKEIDPRVKQYGESGSKTKKENGVVAWNKGLKGVQQAWNKRAKSRIFFYNSYIYNIYDMFRKNIYYYF